MNKGDEAWWDIGYLDEYHKGNLGVFCYNKHYCEKQLY